MSYLSLPSAFGMRADHQVAALDTASQLSNKVDLQCPIKTAYDSGSS